ncbi:M42 family metallopeptidase [bacterium]|nr:M42 family metallopeptidase [bacterium]
MDLKLLEALSNQPGISGYETGVRNIVKSELQKFTSDLKVDNMGNLIAHFPGKKGPRVLLDAHMDEVGFLVNHIDSRGFLRILPVGGIDPRIVYGQRVKVYGKRVYTGIVGSIPPHVTSSKSGEDKATPIEDLFVDLGQPKSVVEKEVQLGDVVTFDSDFRDLDYSVCGKAFDDRIGLFVIIEALRKAKSIDCDLYVVCAVQEEMGLRGTEPAAFRVEPDLAIAIEGTIAVDIPGMPEHKQLAHLGEGVSVRLMDRLMLASRDLTDFIIKTATSSNIKHQLIVKRMGTTDAAAIQKVRKGAKVAALSIPCRYIHSPVSLAYKEDVRSAIDLVTKLIESFSKFKADCS